MQIGVLFTKFGLADGQYRIFQSFKPTETLGYKYTFKKDPREIITRGQASLAADHIT